MKNRLFIIALAIAVSFFTASCGYKKMGYSTNNIPEMTVIPDTEQEEATARAEKKTEIAASVEELRELKANVHKLAEAVQTIATNQMAIKQSVDKHSEKITIIETKKAKPTLPDSLNMGLKRKVAKLERAVKSIKRQQKIHKRKIANNSDLLRAFLPDTEQTTILFNVDCTNLTLKAKTILNNIKIHSKNKKIIAIIARTGKGAPRGGGTNKDIAIGRLNSTVDFLKKRNANLNDTRMFTLPNSSDLENNMSVTIITRPRSTIIKENERKTIETINSGAFQMWNERNKTKTIEAAKKAAEEAAKAIKKPTPRKVPTMVNSN